MTAPTALRHETPSISEQGRPKRRLLGRRVAMAGAVVMLASGTVMATPADAEAVPSLIRAENQGCPPGTELYPPPLAAWDCLGVYRDNANTGEAVGLRLGNMDWGYIHIFEKHGLTQDTITAVIANSAYAIPIFDEDGEYTGRDKYGLYANWDGIPDGTVIEVYVQQEPDRTGVSPDPYNVGVITAFCPPFQGKCPPGINERVAAEMLG